MYGRTEIDNKPKLELYSNITDEFKVADYIKINLCKARRSLLCQLRCGSLGIGIESGRYEGISRDQRICKLCNNGVESELHFLFDCQTTTQKRLETYYEFPELLNYPNNICKLQTLCKKPYVLGKLVSNLWYC